MSVPEGYLKIGLTGLYMRGHMTPKFNFSRESVIPCAEDVPRDECVPGSRYIGKTYDSVDGLIAALDQAGGQLRARKHFKQEYKGDLREFCEDRFDGSVETSSDNQKILLMLYSSDETHPITLSHSQADELAGHLRYARKMVQYLSPKFAAFERATPDFGVDIELDPIRYDARNERPSVKEAPDPKSSTP